MGIEKRRVTVVKKSRWKSRWKNYFMVALETAYLIWVFRGDLDAARAYSVRKTKRIEDAVQRQLQLQKINEKFIEEDAPTGNA